MLSTEAFQKQAIADLEIRHERAGDGIGVHTLAIVCALAGGLFGLVGAFFQELWAGGGVLLPITGAPIIEEALKPAGLYLVLLRWPHLVRGRMHIACLAALGGLAFGLVESLIYVQLYFPDGGADFVLFRFTVPVAMHVVASFVVGLGLSRTAVDWSAGRAPFPKPTRDFYFAGVLLHAIYNFSAIALAISGVLTFE